MVRLSRALRRWSPFGVATGVLAVAWLAVVAGFAYGAVTVRPDLKSVAAAAVVVGIAGAAFCMLGASRET